MRIVVTGAAIGVALSQVLSRVPASQLHGVSPTDQLTFVATVATRSLAGLAAIAAPALRALRVDPAFAMRSD